VINLRLMVPYKTFKSNDLGEPTHQQEVKILQWCYNNLCDCPTHQILKTAAWKSLPKLLHANTEHSPDQFLTNVDNDPEFMDMTIWSNEAS